jgi:hypothetical protein
MSKEPEPKEKLPEKVVIKWEHLTPELQTIIGDKRLIDRFAHWQNIRMIRTARTAAEVWGGVGTVLLANYVYHKMWNFGLLPTTEVIVPAGTLIWRESLVRKIKRLHSVLGKKMNRKGIITTEFEKLYPDRWINPTIVAQTHPIFYVQRNGDLVFMKSDRQEYFKYRYQNTLNRAMWRWREYLEPPTAPETAKEWAKAKIQAAMGKIKKLKPGTLPQPIPVPTG